MRFHNTVMLGLLCLFCFSTPARVHASPAALTFTPCYLTGSGGNGNLQAQCANWSRPLNPDAPDAEHVELFVARLPSTAINPAKDAFTIINGGPGGSSIDLMVDLAPVLQSFTRERDVIVVDQRGTGRSSPLECESLTDAPETFDQQRIVEATQACLEQLQQDPRYFTTTVAVADLDALRAELGYEQLSLYGVSYGTRVALQYMREFPNASRAVVLDGVVPPSISLGANVAINSQAALESVYQRCAQSTDCQRRFPQLKDDFERLSDVLKSAPIPLQLQHPITGVATDLDLTYAHLAVWLRLALYAPETSALVPLIIDQAANKGNYLPIAASALRMVHQLTSSLTYGMHNAVVCTEDAPFYQAHPVSTDALQRSYMGAEMVETLKTMCSVWPRGSIHADMKMPLTSEVKTLVLSGEFDPITPPAYGELILPGLSNARHIVAPGQGHGTIARGCIPRLVLEFVESADLDAVDSQCTEHLSSFPFFTNLMGPPP